MWQAYKQLPEATLVGCWAHVRRKFKEAVPPTTKGKSLSKQGVHYCNQMFTLEKSWENLSNEERHQKRQEKLKPLFDEFFKWCRTISLWFYQDPNLEEPLLTHLIMKILSRMFYLMVN